jgi:hypothetical protein
MGYENEDANPVVFDIETAPIDDAVDYLEPASAPANYKDPEKIAAYVAEAQQKALDKAALDLDLCRIVAIGFHLGFTDAEPAVFLGQDEAEERRSLELFWQTVGDRPLLGFNCLSFDIPVLLRRSLYLGVQARPFLLGKYKHPGIVDVMQHLSFDGLLPSRSLRFYVKRFGLDVPADDTSGADIGRIVAAGDWAAVAHHCRVDVFQTRALAKRIGLA